MSDKVNPFITKQVMEEYEKLRKTNKVNMLNTYAVYTASAVLGLDHLHALLEEDQKFGRRNYLELIQRCNFYLRKYKMKGDEDG